MSGCETGCHFGISSQYGGSLLHRRCSLCGAVEVDLRAEALGVTALVKTSYLGFDPDFEGFERQPGALN